MQIGVDAARAVDNKRVFVIDTDEVTRAALTFMLQDENETHELASVSHALARAEERAPDLILLGVGLLHDSGVQIIEEFVRRAPGVKIVLVNNAPAQTSPSAATPAGIHGLLSKPFTIESVRRKVDRLLGRQVALGIAVEVR